jgi:uncharacterized cofD-like protein
MKKIKGIIFDLDNTLFDVEKLTSMSLDKAILGMIKDGLNCTFEEGKKRINEIIKEDPSSDKFEELAKSFLCFNQEIINEGKRIYYEGVEFDDLEPYPDSLTTLESLKKRYKLILITMGDLVQQNKKIDALKIRDYFDKIIVYKEGEKESPFLDSIKFFDIDPENILVVGDRIDSEIRCGNKLGMTTILIKRGKYKSLRARNKFEEADFEICNISDVLKILDYTDKKEPKIVAIGGGTGLPSIIEGLRRYSEDLTTIVTVTDSGRSSGIIRKEMNLLPPGDLRNCLIALSNSDKLMHDLFGYRFSEGSLNGHNLGNLLIAALTKVSGSFEQGIEKASKILKLKGRVLPSTLDNVHICARLKDGTILEEENNIIDRNNSFVHLRSPIEEVYLKPKAYANAKAIKEILDADLIVICPGSLYTSIISNLLVEGISEAIRKSSAKKVYICNIMSQVNQTHGYKASDHVKQIIRYLGVCPDYVILNDKMPEKSLIEEYEKENAHIVDVDIENIKNLGCEVISQDLLEDVCEKKMLWEKKDLLRHNSDKTAELIMKII